MTRASPATVSRALIRPSKTLELARYVLETGGHGSYPNFRITKGRAMQPPDSSVVPGKCFRVRDGGVRRILKVRNGEVTFVSYHETENAGTSAFLSEPILLSRFVQDLDAEVLCPL